MDVRGNNGIKVHVGFDRPMLGTPVSASLGGILQRVRGSDGPVALSCLERGLSKKHWPHTPLSGCPRGRRSDSDLKRFGPGRKGELKSRAMQNPTMF